ncbi:hypothetical protein B0T19DRAFT_416618 [Cercophora scortea]|uniref:Uncharacterized protein n=1 Tax=Cercophora scortea TaxID=314031 RepID=A0AAE0IXN4_9PEZI|nr:hypothetical protein B0T19DRAFT_416618 [Cercophora scortea]
MAAHCTLPKYNTGDGPTCCACVDTRTKNMPKTTRTRTYCPTCQVTWDAWPDAQCPPEWGLLAPRTDCKHTMALECLHSPAGQAWCCACNDRRKFLSTMERLASYCRPCRSRWERARVDEMPAAWTVGVQGLPERVEDDRGKLRGWVVSYEGEENNAGKYAGMADEGPRYGAPRFGSEDDKWAAQRRRRERAGGGSPAVPKKKPVREPPRMKNPSGDWGDLVSEERVPTSTTSPRPGEVETDYSGYEEKGPQRQGPRFSVPATVSVPKPISSPPSPAPAVSQTEKPGQEKSASAAVVPLSQEDRQRRRDREGLCVGRQPRFMVPAGT